MALAISSRKRIDRGSGTCVVVSAELLCLFFHSPPPPLFFLLHNMELFGQGMNRIKIIEAQPSIGQLTFHFL